MHYRHFRRYRRARKPGTCSCWRLPRSAAQAPQRQSEPQTWASDWVRPHLTPLRNPPRKQPTFSSGVTITGWTSFSTRRSSRRHAPPRRPNAPTAKRNSSDAMRVYRACRLFRLPTKTPKSVILLPVAHSKRTCASRWRTRFDRSAMRRSSCAGMYAVGASP